MEEKYTTAYHFLKKIQTTKYFYPVLAILLLLLPVFTVAITRNQQNLFSRAATTTYKVGVTTIGPLMDSGNQNGMSATQIKTAAGTGLLKNITIYVGDVQSAPKNHMQVALYADNGSNAPGKLLAKSSSKVVKARLWNIFSMPSTPINANTNYWLAFNVDGSKTQYALNSGKNKKTAWKIPTKFGSWANLFGKPTQPIDNAQYSIYMTYVSIYTPTTTPSSSDPTGVQSEPTAIPTLTSVPNTATPNTTITSTPIPNTPMPTGIVSVTCTSVTQYGVTFIFNKAYPCGTFANGDYWVSPNSGESNVVVTALTPNAANGRNGWMVNPSTNESSYDNRLYDYSASLMPSLPYAAKANESLVKAISASGSCIDSGNNPCLSTAVVLTVLGSIPSNNGATIFRPPYVGTAKPLYSTTQLQTALLPSLAPVSSAPSLDSIKNRYQRVQLDHSNSWTGRYMHPSQNFPGSGGNGVSEYGSEIASDNNDAALRLMLSDSTSTKMPALINYVQAGIDWYWTIKDGLRYAPDGGHFVGRKLPVVFASVMLGDQSMKNFIKTAPYAAFGDDGHVYYSTVAGRALFGQSGCGTGEYDQALQNGSGAKDCKDPIEKIDGGTQPGLGGYDGCCIVMPNKASSLGARLLSEGRAIWNYEPFHQYVDRWVTFGAWTQSDPLNRFPNLHGTGANGGSYYTQFQSNMWNAYRSTISP